MLALQRSEHYIRHMARPWAISRASAVKHNVAHIVAHYMDGVETLFNRRQRMVAWNKGGMHSASILPFSFLPMASSLSVYPNFCRISSSLLIFDMPSLYILSMGTLV